MTTITVYLNVLHVVRFRNIVLDILNLIVATMYAEMIYVQMISLTKARINPVACAIIIPRLIITTYLTSQ